MDEPVAEPALGDHRPRDAVHLLDGEPRPDLVHGGLLRRVHEAVDRPEPLRRLPHHHRPRGVAVVAVELAAEVEDDDVAVRDRTLAGLVVRRCGVRAAGHDREVRRPMTVLHQQPREVGRHLPLGPSRERQTDDVRERRVRRRPGAPERVQLVRVLPRPQGAEHRGGRGPGERRRRGLEAQDVHTPDPVVHRRRAARGEQPRDLGVGVDAVDPSVELGQPPGGRRGGQRALELRDQQHRIAVRAQDQQRRPLEGHRVVAGEIDEVPRRRHHHRAEPACPRIRRRSPQPLAKTLASSGSHLEQDLPWHHLERDRRSADQLAVGDDRPRRRRFQLQAQPCAELRDAGIGDVVAVAEHPGQQPVGVRPRSGEDRGVQHPVPRERARRQAEAAVGELPVAR